MNFHLLSLHLLFKSGWYLQGQEHWGFIPVQIVVSFRENKPDNSRIAPSPRLAISQENRQASGRKSGDLVAHPLYSLGRTPMKSDTLVSLTEQVF